MELNWTKLISDLLPRQLRRIKMVSLLMVLTEQVRVCHANLLAYMSKNRSVALRNYSAMSIERMIYDELNVGAVISEGDGKPIDFVVSLSGYVDEQRIHALVDKYKLAGKSYKILFSDVTWRVAFVGHVCERGEVVWGNKFVDHVCERREDITEVKFVNHLCQQGPLIYIVPQPITYGGSTSDQVQVNICVDPESTDINNYRTSTLTITYTLLGWESNAWTTLRTATKSSSLHQTDYEYDWNRLEAVWVRRCDRYKIRVDAITPETDGDYVYVIKNN